MIRRRRRAQHANHERWLVSYADFITLLFAFFVVLYASAQVDQRKIGKLAMAIQTAFQELGVFPGSSANLPHDLPALPPEALKKLQQVEQKNDKATAPDEATMDEVNLATLQDELQQALKQEIAARAVALHRETEGLVISLREFGFFDSGSSTLRASALPALDRIAAILAVRTCRLRIEGHTDNVPVHTAQWATNWELSTARSTELVRLLITRHRYAPQRLSAAGYAEYHPIASNETPQGRAQNRRVDIVILSDRLVRRESSEAAAKPSAAIRWSD